MNDVISVLKGDNSDNLARIREYENSGLYVFHGSSNPNIELLEPRKANDVDPHNLVNNDTAVYASPCPQVCIKGIVDHGEPREGCWVMAEKEGGIVASIPSAWKNRVVESSGVLYVLPKETFFSEDPRSLQSKSYSKVKPVDKIFVTFNDFIALGGKVVWT